MAATIGDIRNKVIPRIRDDAAHLTVTNGGQVDAAILSAVEEYQKTFPLEKAVRIAGSGTYKYAVAGMTGFVDGFSELRGIAYPHLITDQILRWRTGQEVGLVRDDGGLFVWFNALRPAAAEFFLALFTVPHTATVAAWTAQATDDEAIADLAAGFCCDQLAALFGEETDTTVTADSVNRLQKSAEYRSMATRYKDSYKRKTASVGRATAVANVGNTNQGFGDYARTDYLFHGRVRF